MEYESPRTTAIRRARVAEKTRPQFEISPDFGVSVELRILEREKRERGPSASGDGPY